MFLAPVIERELRRALHANKGHKSRFRVALIGAVVVVVFLWIFALSGSAQWGVESAPVVFLGGALFGDCSVHANQCRIILGGTAQSDTRTAFFNGNGFG